MTTKKNIKEPTSKKMCQVIIELIMIDRNGKQSEPFIVNGNSWTQQAAQHMRAAFNSNNEASVTDTGNVSRTIRHNASTNQRMKVLNAAADTTLGIVIGTGSTGETRDDFQVETLIAEGTGVDDMNYLGTTVALPIAITNGYRMIVQRTMTNNSALTIGVRELCVICATHDTGSTIRKFLILRDVLGADFNVGVGDSILVKYNFDFKVS